MKHELHEPGLISDNHHVAADLERRQELSSIPFFLVMGYLFVDYGRPQDWVKVLEVLHPGVLVLGGGILALLFAKRPPIPKLGKYMMIFTLLMAIGIPGATNNFSAFNYTKNFALLIFGAALPIMVFVDSYRRMVILSKFWVAIHVPLAVYSILHKGVGIGSFLGDENDLCLVINMIIPYAFFLLLVSRSQLEKMLLLGSIAIFLLAVIASLSRGGFVGLTTVAFFIWLKLPRKILATVIVGMLALTFLAMAPDSYWNEMNTIKTADSENDTGHQRLYLWGIGWEMFLDNPVMGVGPGNYQYNNSQYSSEHEKGRGVHIWGKVAHSLYFTLLPELGILGVFVFVLLLVGGWKQRAAIRKYARRTLTRDGPPSEKATEVKMLSHLAMAMDVALVAYLVTGAFIAVLYYPHFWILTAFTVALKRVFDEVTVEQSSAQPVTTEKSMSAS
jgi:probable O-glycosylation ligase (exosortase A-associated)